MRFRAPALGRYVQENPVHRLLFVSIMAIAPAFAWGQVNGADAEDGPSEVVVTATRIPTPAIQIASSVTVVSADEISERQFYTVPDLLKTVPGLNVVQTGGPGGQTSVFIRGTDSNHTKVFIDGIDVSDPSSATSSFDLGQLLTQDIDRAEVLRGPQSGLYGSDAIGGVINVITKSGSGPAQFSAGIETGSFDTFNQVGEISGSLDQFHYAATVEHFHAGSTPVTPLDLLPPGQARINDYDDNLTESTKLGFNVTDQFDLGLVARYTDTHLRLTGENYDNYPAPDTPDTAQSENNTKQYYTRATAHLVSFGGAFEQTLGAAYSNVKSYEYSPLDYEPGESESDYFGARVKFDWQGNIKLAPGEQLLLGGEHERDSITAPISASTTIESGYAELQSALGNNIFNALNVRYDNNDRFGSEVTYRLAPTYLILDSGTKLKASVGTGFKAPTLNQMFQNFPDFDFFGNPDLKPETSLGYDVGFEQALLNQRLNFGATYFRNNIKNLIATNAEDTSYTNIGRVTTQGVESFVSYQPLTALILRLDYTYTEATDDILDQELLRRPKHKGSLNAEWHATTRWSLNATLLSVSSWVDGNRDFSIPRLNAPGYTTVDVAAGYELSGHWALTARITNLLNRHYENPDGFDQPTIGAYAGIKAKY
jgi:vitamin B12 transporter